MRRDDPNRTIVEAIADAMRASGDHGEDKTPSELRESAYRRGFHQGAHMVLRMIEEGMGFGEISDYLSDIQDWRFRMKRFRSSRSKWARPPEPWK